MNPSKLLRAAIVALAFVCAARAEISAQAWLETYYLNPQPTEVSAAVQRLSREGYLDRTENVAVAIGFIGTLFTEHPAHVDAWLNDWSTLTAKHQRVIACALWQAGHPLAAQRLRELGQDSPHRSDVEQLADLPSQRIVDTPVQSPSSMRLQWGAFLATGDERNIVRILDAFGSNAPGLTTSVRMALAKNAADHPRVLEICRAQLDKQPAEIRAEVRAALNVAEGSRPRS